MKSKKGIVMFFKELDLKEKEDIIKCLKINQIQNQLRKDKQRLPVKYRVLANKKNTQYEEVVQLFMDMLENGTESKFIDFVYEQFSKEKERVVKSFFEENKLDDGIKIKSNIFEENEELMQSLAKILYNSLFKEKPSIFFRFADSRTNIDIRNEIDYRVKVFELRKKIKDEINNEFNKKKKEEKELFQKELLKEKQENSKIKEKNTVLEEQMRQLQKKIEKVEKESKRLKEREEERSKEASELKKQIKLDGQNYEKREKNIKEKCRKEAFEILNLEEKNRLKKIKAQYEAIENKKKIKEEEIRNLDRKKINIKDKIDEVTLKKIEIVYEIEEKAKEMEAIKMELEQSTKEIKLLDNIFIKKMDKLKEFLGNTKLEDKKIEIYNDNIEVSTITGEIDMEDIIENLRENLSIAGIEIGYETILSEYLVNLILLKRPILLIGYDTRFIANAISIAIQNKVVDIINIAEGDSSKDILEKIKSSDNKILLLENIVDNFSESIYLPLIKSVKEKIFIFTSESVENLRIINESIFNYMIPVDLSFVLGLRKENRKMLGSELDIVEIKEKNDIKINTRDYDELYKNRIISKINSLIFKEINRKQVNLFKNEENISKCLIAQYTLYPILKYKNELGVLEEIFKKNIVENSMFEEYKKHLRREIEGLDEK